MSRPPAGHGNGSQAFMWVSLLVMAVSCALIAWQSRHPAPSPTKDIQAVSHETANDAPPPVMPPPTNDGVPRNM